MFHSDTRHAQPLLHCFFFFFFNDTATTEIYTLSLHDALPIWPCHRPGAQQRSYDAHVRPSSAMPARAVSRSEEHTSELQSRENLVCRLLLQKKKIRRSRPTAHTNNRTALR